MRINQVSLQPCVDHQQPEQVHIEWVIDGVLLEDHINRVTKSGCPGISPLGWMGGKYLKAYAERLVGRGEPSLANGRCEIMVCGICADLSCGCVACNVTVDGEHLIWSELGLDNPSEADVVQRYNMGSFRFKLEQVVSLLEPWLNADT